MESTANIGKLHRWERTLAKFIMWSRMNIFLKGFLKKCSLYSFVKPCMFIMIFSRFMHVVACISTYSFQCQICFLVWIYHILFILHQYSNVDGHLACFLVLAITNRTAMNICVSFSLITKAIFLKI